MFVVTVSWRAKPDQAAAFADCLIKQAHNSLTKEANCLQFDVAIDSDNPNCFFLYEVYRASSDFDAHLVSDHFLQFAAETEAMVEAKIVKQFHRIQPVT